MDQKQLENLLEKVESNYYEIKTQTALIVVNFMVTGLLFIIIFAFIMAFG